MDERLLLVLCVAAPVIGSFFLSFIGNRAPKGRNLLALVFVAFSFFSAAALLPKAMSGSPVSFQILMPYGMTFGFYADALAVFMALISSFIGAVIVFYSFSYIKHYPNQNEYYMMVTLFLGAMMGIVFSSNLLFIYLFWEISAICCWRLIGFFREKPYILRADKAFLVTVGGALLMLLGFISLYGETGTFYLPELKGMPIPNSAVILILCGILSKSATLPFHTWLPDAGVAPSPVTSLLHAAVLVKIGVYVFARLFLLNFSLDAVWHQIIPVVAAVSALVSAGAALLENDIKRIIAYSTVSQIGFIFLGLSCGSALGAAGAVLYIMMHGLAKGGLFLCAGVVEQNTHNKDIRKMGGLISTMPLTAAAFLACSFSIMGIPPFGGFFAKYLVIGGPIAAEQPWIAFTFIVGAILTIIYLMRLFVMVFLAEPKTAPAREGSRGMVFSVLALGLLSLLGGLFINFPSQIVEAIVSSMGW